MRYQVSRIIVQHLCDDREDLVPYLNRIIDSLERHGGLYQTKLAEVVPVDVIEEINHWLKSQLGGDNADFSRGLEASLDLLEQIFAEAGVESVR